MKIAIALLALSISAIAQTSTAVKAVNPVCTSNCPVDITKQSATSGATAKKTNSSASQAGNSTASNVSGVTVSPITQSSTGPLTQTGTQSASAANNGNTNSTGASTSNAHTGNVQSTNSTGASTSTSAGGRAQASGGAGGNGGSGGMATGGAGTGGNASTGASSVDSHAVENSTTNVNEKTTFIPSMLPQTPVVQLAGAGIDKEVLACGPRQNVIHNRVTQTMTGLFHDHHIDVGETDDLVPFDGDPYIKVPLDDGRDGYEMYGDQPILYTTVLGAASGRSIGGGGTTAGQASGQLGFGGSSSVQRLVVKIELRRCDLGTVVIEEPKPEPVPKPATASSPLPDCQFVLPIPVLTPPTAPLSTPTPRRHKRKPIPACVPKEK